MGTQAHRCRLRPLGGTQRCRPSLGPTMDSLLLEPTELSGHLAQLVPTINCSWYVPDLDGIFVPPRGHLSDSVISRILSVPGFVLDHMTVTNSKVPKVDLSLGFEPRTAPGSQFIVGTSGSPSGHGSLNRFQQRWAPPSGCCGLRKEEKRRELLMFLGRRWRI